MAWLKTWLQCSENDILVLGFLFVDMAAAVGPSPFSDHSMSCACAVLPTCVLWFLCFGQRTCSGVVWGLFRGCFGLSASSSLYKDTAKAPHCQTLSWVFCFFISFVWCVRTSEAEKLHKWRVSVHAKVLFYTKNLRMWKIMCSFVADFELRN